MQAASFIPAPKIHEITSPEIFDRECMGVGSSGSPRLLCIVAFVPPMFSTTAVVRNVLLSDLAEVAKRFTSYDIAYFWAQAGDHRQAPAGTLSAPLSSLAPALTAAMNASIIFSCDEIAVKALQPLAWASCFF